LTTIERPEIGAPEELPGPVPEIVVVGGAGHVGLPLSLAFADAGFRVRILDTSRTVLAEIAAGNAPFLEPGTDVLIRRFVSTDRLSLSSAAAAVSGADTVIVAVSLSDERRWSSVAALDETMDALAPHLAQRALVVLRNTVYPGTTARVRERLRASGLEVDVVFCPERLVQGRALEELHSLPQIVGADDEPSGARADALFRRLGIETVHSTSIEAELAKLVANGWRYISFAAANEFWMLANAAGVDYGNVLRVVRHDYPRAQGLPGPGFAAGPCLVKDTVGLAAFAGPNGALLRAALDVNEELPASVVARMEERFGPLAGRHIGLLGMAFKAGSDDMRGAASGRLHELLRARGATVLRTDPYVSDPANLPLSEVLEKAEILVIATPHAAYRELDPPQARLVDIWGITRAGIRV
jgi:UDP-N-acetyl-D-mannosaminuronic acid dehydrogenase